MPAYAAAALIGLLFVASVFPGNVLFPADYRLVAQYGDKAQGIIAQRYFLAAPWGWPPLVAPALDGVNVGLTDSLPLALILLKPLRGLLPPGFFVQEVWIALAWTLQPVAAVYALRGTGVRSWPGALAVAALSLLPTLLFRFGHTALCTHALILVALGLYLRLVRGGGPWGACVPLLLASILVHPYLMAMVAAVLAAGPLSLLLAGRRWWPAAAWLAAGLCGMAGLALLLGFGGAVTPDGYGFFSMNLLGPLLPSHSGLFPSMAVDATGGQAGEGYQYLGAGVLGLSGVAGVLVLTRRGFPWRRHRGLLLVAAGLTLFAASTEAYLGGVRLMHVEYVPAFVQQFRVTGRFFWPVAYIMVVAAVAVVVRGLPRPAATAVLLAAVALQAADLSTTWRIARGWLRPVRWEVDAAVLSPIIAAHRRLTIWPKSFCGVDGGQNNFMQVLLVASVTAPEVNTMYTARVPAGLVCDAVQTLGQAWRPQEMRVVMPQAEANWRLVPEGDRVCRRVGALRVCSRDDAAMLALPP